GDAGRRLAHDRQRKAGSGSQSEAAVGVEEGGRVEAGARGYLGDRVLGAGQLEAAGAAAVDDLQLGDLADRGNDRAPPLSELSGRAALHGADRRPAQPPSRRLVANAGDLTL